MQFLMGLNANYDHIKDQILIMEPLPTFDKAYSMMSMIERQGEMNNSRPVEMANSVMANSEANFSSTQKNSNRERTTFFTHE